jgi:hypothetical protein
MLPGQPGSESFMLAYQAALAGQEVCKAGSQGNDPGSFDRLVKEYFDSPDYRRLSCPQPKA